MAGNNPFEVLMNEHEIISAAEEKIESLKDLMTQDENRYKSEVGKLLDFFKVYSDGFHHGKEEKILFPMMNDNPAFILQGIITELEEHHESFRETVAEISSNLDKGDLPKVQQGLKRYINDLKDHIAVENDELFIMAESLFTDEEVERMYFMFADLDREIGDQVKSDWEKFMKE